MIKVMNNIIYKNKVGAVVLGLILAMGFTSCNDLFEPAIENHLGSEYMYEHPDYADGVLGNAYTRLPNGSYPFTEVATDDAVTNDATNSYRKMTAVDNWTSNNNPVETWRNCRAAIQYINLFLANADKVNWNSDETIRDMYHQRYIGEARGLRALFLYYLLRAHGGYDNEGKLLGIPLVLLPTTIGKSTFGSSSSTSVEGSTSVVKEEKCRIVPALLIKITVDIVTASESSVQERLRS